MAPPNITQPNRSAQPHNQAQPSIQAQHKTDSPVIEANEGIAEVSRDTTADSVSKDVRAHLFGSYPSTGPVPLRQWIGRVAFLLLSEEILPQAASKLIREWPKQATPEMLADAKQFDVAAISQMINGISTLICQDLVYIRHV
jgi:hypothetical protein